MNKMRLSLIAIGLLSLASIHVQAGETCKVSMMGRICYNDDGSLRGESAPVEKKSPSEADKMADNDSKKVVAK